jgi:uncharacterized oligopeptide transporter (OPT) family protein
MKVFLLQVIAFICYLAAIAGIKIMDLSGWATYPLLAVVMLLLVLGVTLPYRLDRKSS